MRVERCDTAVGLFIARNPSAPGLRASEIAAGATIADMIAHAVNIGALGVGLTQDQIADELRDLRVYVDGEALPFATPEERLVWIEFVPNAGSVVNLQVEPAGSNSSARTALTLVLVAVAVVSAFTVGAFTASLWQLGAAIVPQLAFPIKTPDRLEGPNDRGALQTQGNTIRKRGMMPLQFGSGRVAFDLAANAYSSNINGDVWLTAIFGLHYGPCSLAGVKIGETLLSDYPAQDVRVQEILLPGPRVFDFYAQTVHQENLQDELDIGGAAEVHTTEDDCDRVEIDLTWPQGLQFRKANGSIVQQEIRVQVEWAPTGSESWTAAPLEGGPFYNRLGGALPTGTIDVMARTQDPVRRTLAWTKGNSDAIKVRIRAWDPDNDDTASATQATYWTALRSIAFKAPIVDTNLACLAISIKSSDDLGGTLPVITGVITPHAPVWTGTEWLDDIADWAPSDNHVAHARMMLMGPAAAKPLTADQFDDSAGDVHDLIEERGWKGCYRLSTEATQEDALKILGAMGRFSCYDLGEGLCFVPDWEKPVARQIFSGRNVEGYSYTRTFPEPVHVVFVEFQNIDEDSKDDEVPAYMPGYDASNATLIETVRLQWACTPDRAFREGNVYLTKRVLQVEAHQWTAGADAIACAYGDRVRVRHPSALYGVGEGRVAFRRMAGGLVTGLRLDDEIVMEAGESYALDARRPDKVLPGVSVVTAPGRTRDLTFPTPLSPDDAPEVDDLVVFGKVGIVTEDLEIIDFAPSGDKVQISARRYLGAEIAAAELGDIPEFTTKLSQTPTAPRPRLLGVTQATPEGVKIAFDIDPVRGALIESFPVRWRRASTGTDENPWQTLTPAAANARVIQTPPFPEAVSAGQDPDAIYKIDVEIRSKLRTGDVSRPLLVGNIQVSRGVEAPREFSAVGVKRTAADETSYPALVVSAAPLASGMEQDLVVESRPHGGGADDWTSAGPPLPSTNPRGDFTNVAGGSILDVRARWRTSDNYTSGWVTVSGVSIPSGALVADSVLKYAGFTAAQIIAFNEMAEAAQSAARDAQLRILDQIAQARRREIDLIKLLTPPSGRPPGVTLDEQIRQVETATETIAEHYVEMTAGLGDAAAGLALESLTRATEDTALADYQIALAAVVDGNYSDITSSLTTLTTSQAATALALTNLTSSFNSNAASVSSSLGTLTTNLNATSAALTSLTSSFDANVASVSSQLTSITSVNSAQSSSITSLSSTVGTNTSSITTISTALATLSGQVGAAFGVKLNVNNHVVGFQGINNGLTGGWIFSGDYFAIAVPGDIPRYPFYVSGDTVYLTNTRIHGNLTIDGTLDAPQLAARAATSTARSNGSSTINGTGGFQTILSHYVYLAKAGTVDATATVSQHFPSGDRHWELELYIDGDRQYRAYGDNAQDSVPLSGSKECAAGTRLVEVIWSSHSSVNVDYRNLTSMGSW